MEEEIGCYGKTVIALLAERHGVFVEGVPLPVRLLLFGSEPEIEPLSQFAGNLGRVIEHFAHPSELCEDFRPDTQTTALVQSQRLQAERRRSDLMRVAAVVLAAAGSTRFGKPKQFSLSRRNIH